MSDFIEQLGKVLRFSASESDVHHLLNEIATNPDHQHTPDSAHRLVTADALDEVGRSQEANWLRQRRPVAVRDGKVVAQRYTKTHVHNAMFPVCDAINRATDWEYPHDEFGSTSWKHSAFGIPNPTLDQRKRLNFGADGHRHGMLEEYDAGGNETGNVFHVTEYPDWFAKKYEQSLTDGGFWDGMEPADRDAVRHALNHMRNVPVTEDDPHADRPEEDF